MNIGRKKEIESLWRLVVVPGTVGTSPPLSVVSVSNGPAPGLGASVDKWGRSSCDGLDGAFGIKICILCELCD